MRNKILVLIFYLLVSVIANAGPQDIAAPDTSVQLFSTKPKLVLQLGYERDGVLKLDGRSKTTLADARYHGVNFRVGIQGLGKDSINFIYNQIYNYPIYGVGIYAGTFDKDYMGNPFAVYGFVAVPIAPNLSKRLRFNYRVAMGIAGGFKSFDIIENPKNLNMGTSTNLYIDLGLEATYRLTQKFHLGAGVAFHHFSNGSIVLPNTGINLVPFSVSATYIPSGKAFEPQKFIVPPLDAIHELQINYAFGHKQINRWDERGYFKSTLGAAYTRQFGYKWRLGAGMDVFYSASGQDAVIAKDQAGKFSALFSYGPVVHIDHILNKQLYINGSVGGYLHRNKFNGEDTPIFLRVGVRAKLYRQFFAGVSIKAHKTKADFLEWTTGYGFPLNKK